jgi:hypothetical protein
MNDADKLFIERTNRHLSASGPPHPKSAKQRQTKSGTSAGPLRRLGAILKIPMAADHRSRLAQTHGARLCVRQVPSP